MSETAQAAVDSQARIGKRARSRGAIRKGFNIHATTYVGVQALLVGTWLLTKDAETHPWFAYPMLGWGAGVGAHYAAVRDSFGHQRD